MKKVALLHYVELKREWPDLWQWLPTIKISCPPSPQQHHYYHTCHTHFSFCGIWRTHQECKQCSPATIAFRAMPLFQHSNLLIHCSKKASKPPVCKSINSVFLFAHRRHGILQAWAEYEYITAFTWDILEGALSPLSFKSVYLPIWVFFSSTVQIQSNS